LHFFGYYYKRNDEEDISNYIKRVATGGIHPNMGEQKDGEGTPAQKR
jgi:hypothetical protein